MKLIYRAEERSGKCQICMKMDVVYRKLYNSKEKVSRWRAEGRNPVSTEKELDDIYHYEQELRDLQYAKMVKMKSI